MKSFLYIILLLMSLSLSAQDNTEAKIYAKAYVDHNGTIFLRWAPSSYGTWKKLNTYGFEVVRYTITRDKQRLLPPPKKDIGTFLPKPLPEWEEDVLHNNNAAILAQAIYGASFEVKGQDKLNAIVAISEEQQQRFTWGLFAADQDFKVAQKAGLGYIDRDVHKNERYLYKIKSLVPENIQKIQEGATYLGFADFTGLPKPLDLGAYFMDKSVMLSWDGDIFKNFYVTYVVEKSEDGKKFSRLNKLPFMSLNGHKKGKKKVVYLDSIPNNKTFYYRVKGKTIFGLFSPPSKIVSGQAKASLEYMPALTTYKILEDNKSVKLQWKFPAKGEKLIRSFVLKRSNKVNGKYKTLIKDIPPKARQITYKGLQESNYFTLTAIGKNGGARSSFALFVQPVDSIPPVKPEGLTGRIDSLGVVRLHWQANPDKDVLGYRVYRGNNPKEEMSQITVSPHRGTVYYDSIGVHNLNRYVYYKIIAVDHRYNMSESSKILKIKKPDYIPPSQPVFSNYKIKGTQVLLEWINSPDKDVVKHELWRQEQQQQWQRIFTQKTGKDRPVKTSYTDQKVEAGKTYYYKVLAIDDSGLQAQTHSVLELQIPKKLSTQKIKRLLASVDKAGGYIELYWKKLKNTDVAYIKLYRAKKGGAMTLLRQLPATTNYYKDSFIKPNNVYEYLLQPVLKNGTPGLTNTLTVKY